MNACNNCSMEYQGELPDVCEKCGKHTTPRFTEALADYLQGEGFDIELAKLDVGIRIIIPFNDPAVTYTHLEEIKKLSIEPSTNG